VVLWLVLASVAAPLAAKLTKVQNNDTLMALPRAPKPARPWRAPRRRHRRTPRI
jgi:hypothetical protein